MKTPDLDALIPRQLQPLGAVLLLSSLVAFGLVTVRMATTSSGKYAFLVMNLILAWVPVLFSVMLSRWYHRGQMRSSRFVFAALLWLLFLPNAPYIVTDFVHLTERPPVPLWFDLLTLMSFAWTGVLLGFVSLYLVHRTVAERWGEGRGWLFVVTISALSGLGVYIGRFLRWNSWDFFVSPLRLMHDILHTFGRPWSRPGPLVFTMILGVFCIMAYLALYVLAQGRSGAPANVRNERPARPA